MAALIMLVLLTFFHPDTNLLPACVAEDDTNCYFDASTRGNGEGTSFIALGGNHGGESAIVIFFKK